MDDGLGASYVRQLRDAANRAQEEYAAAASRCIHDIVEQKRNAVGECVACVGCGKVKRYGKVYSWEVVS